MMNEAPHLVLVHGAWHGGWSWEPTAAVLRDRGLAVTVIDHLPPTAGDARADLTADADAVRDVVASIGGPVALVGHSYGGMVVSELAGSASVVVAVYVAAFLPPAAGMTVLDLVGGQLPPWIVVDDDGLFCTIDPGEAVRLMASNAPDASASGQHVAQMVPQTVAAFATPSSMTGWGQVPVSYLLTLQDEVVPPEGQRQMAAAAGAVVTEIDAPHIPMVGDPSGVADFIEVAVARAGERVAPSGW